MLMQVNKGKSELKQSINGFVERILICNHFNNGIISMIRIIFGVTFQANKPNKNANHLNPAHFELPSMFPDSPLFCNYTPPPVTPTYTHSDCGL